MMKLINKIALLLLVMLHVSCGKEFLDIKRDQSQVTPTTVSDYAALFNNLNMINSGSSYILSVIGGDEYFLSEAAWSGLREPLQKNGYIWAEDVYEQTEVPDWDNAYHRILLANIALDGLAGILPSEDESIAWNITKGTALFLRAFNYYQLVQLFCKPYDSQTATTDLGVPLRLEPDITLKSTRASVYEVYHQILNDLNAARPLLPEMSESTLQPSKASCFALLAKTCLHMREYGMALSYAEACLSITDELFDYNLLDTSGYYPFHPQPFSRGDNEEMIFFSSIRNVAVTDPTRLYVSDALLDLYEEDDLRTKVYFGRDAEGLYSGEIGKILFKGSYSGAGPLGFFSGLSTNEMYLIAAECNARLGDGVAAKERVGYLLRHRYVNGKNPEVDVDEQRLLLRILEERRKELVFRGICWEDLRRLNKEPWSERTVKRVINNKEITLAPNSPRYVWPLPDSEIALNDLKQNDR